MRDRTLRNRQVREQREEEPRAELRDTFDVDGFVLMVESIMEAHHWSLPGLERRSGVSRETLRRMFGAVRQEYRQVSLSLTTACLLARTLDLNLDEYVIPLED